VMEHFQVKDIIKAYERLFEAGPVHFSKRHESA
jgi:hypothetical protein